MNQPIITVFTPTYNRAYTLQRLYDSLKSQTDYSFEWLIIDDGSTDNTNEVVGKFCNDAFSIRYMKKKNGGKHTAYNWALEEAMGKYFMCVDSDDTLAPDAIASIVKSIEPGTGICAYKSDMSGHMLGTSFPEGIECTTSFDLYAKYGCSGEYTFVYPTQIVAKVPFPVFKDERFVTESVVYDQLDNYCSIKLLPAVITICEYQSEGYSADTNKLMKENPAGYCLYYMQRIDKTDDIFQRVLIAGKYQCFKLIAKKQYSNYNGKHRTLVAACIPFGMLFRLYYRFIRKI